MGQANISDKLALIRTGIPCRFPGVLVPEEPLSKQEPGAEVIYVDISSGRKLSFAEGGKPSAGNSIVARQGRLSGRPLWADLGGSAIDHP